MNIINVLVHISILIKLTRQPVNVYCLCAVSILTLCVDNELDLWRNESCSRRGADSYTGAMNEIICHHSNPIFTSKDLFFPEVKFDVKNNRKKSSSWIRKETHVLL